MFADRHQKMVKLADLGFAHQLNNPKQLLNTFCGSPPYAAPELFADRQYKGQPVDLWALGVLLYFMCTGLMPFRAQTVAQLKQLILDGEYHMPNHVSTPCQHAIRGLLQHVPSNRFTIAQLKQTRFLAEQRFVRPLPAFRLHSGLRRSLTVGSFYSITDRNDRVTISSDRDAKKNISTSNDTNVVKCSPLNCCSESVAFGCSVQTACNHAAPSEWTIVACNSSADKENRMKSNPDMAVPKCVEPMSAGLIARQTSLRKSLSNNLSGDSGHGTTIENDGSRSTVDRLNQLTQSIGQVFASLDSPRISFRSVERIAPSVDASVFGPLDSCSYKDKSGHHNKPSLSNTPAVTEEFGLESGCTIDCCASNATILRHKSRPAFEACKCCNSLESTLMHSEHHPIKTAEFKNYDDLETHSAPLPSVSEQEHETLRRLARLGITRSMLENCADKGVRSNLVGIYRIVLHQVISAQTIMANDPNRGMSKAAQEANESNAANGPQRNSIDLNHYPDPRNKSQSTNQSDSARIKAIGQVEPINSIAHLSTQSAAKCYANVQRKTHNQYDASDANRMHLASVNEPQSTCTGHELLHTDVAGIATSSDPIATRTGHAASQHSLKNAFTISDLQPMPATNETIGSDTHRNSFGHPQPLSSSSSPLPPPPALYANLPIVGSKMISTDKVIGNEAGLTVKVPPPCVTSDYRLPSPIVPFKPGLTEYLEEERRWRKIQKRKKAKSKKSLFTCCLL